MFVFWCFFQAVLKVKGLLECGSRAKIFRVSLEVKAVHTHSPGLAVARAFGDAIAARIGSQKE